MEVSAKLTICHAILRYSSVALYLPKISFISPNLTLPYIYFTEEYVVDHVSRNGVHKTMMCWVYDKRPANGAQFCYFGCEPILSDSHEGKILIPYVRGVLDAMGVKHGASHAEVMMTPDGPCLVEMNCRTNGGDGIWRPLTRALTGGYTQVEACADAYLDGEAFDRYPDKPPSPFKAAGQEIELVSYSRGIVKSTPGYEMIAQLPSFVHLESNIKPGSTVEYTIDLDTCVGTVCLMHPDESVVTKDVEFIRYMETINGLFQYEPVLENLKRPRAEAVVQKSVSIKPPHHRVFGSEGGGALIRKVSQNRDLSRKSFQFINVSEEVVVLVDPYSTGACIAQEFMRRGCSVVALWTTGYPSEMKEYIPKTVSVQGSLEYLAQIDEAKTIVETVSSLEKAAGEMKIIAVLAGDDAGVDLADALSERLGLRTNGTGISRRDKKLQQEVLERVGLSSMRQAGGSDFSEISLFLKQEKYPIVLKPGKSAPGSDGGVKLCWKFEDAKQHFNFLMNNQIVTNALEVPAVLVQEYLRGKEYVVDHVSRDGVHKTMMIWYLEKRSANGSNNVYISCTPVDSKSPEAGILVPYVRMVLTSLGVQHGPSHAEVMLCSDGPCLVKLNCSAHKNDGNWVSLCRALTGYSQVEVTTEAYLDGDKSEFSKIPSLPPSPFKASGLELLLTSFSRGVVKATPGFDIIQQLPSFVSIETGITIGSSVEYTTDLFSSVGSVILMHPDQATLESDVACIREMEDNNTLFVYDTSEMTGVLKSGSLPKSSMDPLVISTDRPDLHY